MSPRIYSGVQGHEFRLCRVAPEGRFSEQDRLIKQSLMPHLITVFARSQLAPWVRNAAKEIHYPLAAIADEAGALRHVGEGFAEMLQREWPDWRGPMLPEPLREAIAAGSDKIFSGTQLVATIARATGLAPKNVQNYLSLIYHKLGVKNKIQLVEILREAG